MSLAEKSLWFSHRRDHMHVRVTWGEGTPLHCLNPTYLSQLSWHLSPSLALWEVVDAEVKWGQVYNCSYFYVWAIWDAVGMCERIVTPDWWQSMLLANNIYLLSLLGVVYNYKDFHSHPEWCFKDHFPLAFHARDWLLIEKT